MMPDLIPAPDVAPIPGPVWLFQFLLVFTFFLHLIFVNLTLGGTLLAAWARVFGRGREADPRTLLASRLASINGYGVSLAITTGVAPLLFIQVLYGQYFYSATILLGWIWFCLLVVLMVGYYALYLFKFRSEPSAPVGTVWLVLAAAMFLAVAVVQVMVNLLHSQPGRWADALANPWTVLADPTFLPRLAHFVLAAIGFSALVVCWWAVRQAGRGGGAMEEDMARYTWKWALWTTLLTLVDGFLLLLLLPGNVLGGLMRGGATVHLPLTLGILLGLALLVLLARAADPVARPGLLTGALLLFLGSMASMTVTRHQVRVQYLLEFTARHRMEEVSQWGIFFLFAVTLVAGLATVAWMVHRVLTSPATGDDAA